MEKSLVILTGAGISAESGIRTFRDGNGLWENHRIEDVASPEGFKRDPKLVHTFYNARRAQLLSGEVHPNLAHQALAKLEKSWPGKFLLVTQNVDDLHERAGSKNLIHMHGELLKSRCGHCEHVFDWGKDLTRELDCPHCTYAGGLRPQIVWFGEMPLGMDEIDEALTYCSHFIAIGTSGQVYPAAGFVLSAPPLARTIELNLQDSEVSTLFKERRQGKASEIVPALVEELLQSI